MRTIVSGRIGPRLKLRFTSSRMELVDAFNREAEEAKSQSKYFLQPDRYNVPKNDQDSNCEDV